MSDVQMIAPISGAKKKMVKIKALRPIIDPSKGIVMEPGAVLEVDEEAAKEYCDHVFTGQYSFSGERSGRDGLEKHKIVRAERVA